MSDGLTLLHITHIVFNLAGINANLNGHLVGGISKKKFQVLGILFFLVFEMFS